MTCASACNVCVIGDVIKMRLGEFVFFVRMDCALFQVCMVAPYGSAGTRLGHCTVQVHCGTRILHVHLMDKPWSQYHSVHRVRRHATCVNPDVIRMRLGGIIVRFFVRMDCALFRVCMVAP